MAGHIPAQHVGAVAAGPCPHADHTILRRTTECDILGRRSRGYRYTLSEAGMVEPLAPRDFAHGYRQRQQALRSLTARVCRAGPGRS